MVVRLRALLAFAVSLRGLLVVTAAVSGLGAVLVPAARAWLAAFAIALAALILALTGLRQAEMNQAVRALSRSGTTIAVGEVSHSLREGLSLPYGPRGATEGWVESARRRLLETRSSLSLSGEEPVPVNAGGPLDVGDAGPNDGPTISVIVPCFNDARYVGQALESVRRQLFEDWECIVVDDGSGDSSVAIVARIAETDERIRLVRHGVNSGISAARNTGLRLSRGRYLTFLDADDVLRPDSFLDRAETLAQTDDPLVGGVFCGVTAVSGASSVDLFALSDPWTPSLGFVDFINGSDECPFPIMAPLVRRDVIISAGGFDEDLMLGGEDWDLWLRIMRGGFIFVPSALRSAIHRERPESMSRRNLSESVRFKNVLIDRAYDPIDISSPFLTAYSFREAIGYYQRALARARWAITSAAMALTDGDRHESHACLALLEPNSWIWIDRHLDVTATARSGVLKALGLSDDLLPHLESELMPLVNEVVAEARSLTAIRTEIVSSDVSDPPEVEYLLAPQNRIQLLAMLAEIDRDGRSIGVLMLDRTAGAQGVRDVQLPEGTSCWSLDEWWLRKGRFSSLVVPAVRDTTIEALLEEADVLGASIVEIKEPDAEVMLPLGTRESPAQTRNGIARGSRELASNPNSAFGPGALLDPLAPESIWNVEENWLLRVDGDRIAEFLNRHEGERVFIVGNGPSLNRTDLRKLEHEVSFGVNAIFLATDETGYRPSYYVVEDTAVVRDNLERIKGYQAKDHRFFPSIYRELLGEFDDTTYFNMNGGFYEKRSPSYSIPRFSTDASQRLFTGQSVTIINLQLAYYMGFREVVLIGMDFSYSVPEASVIEGNHILSMGDDPNHFHPDYFGKGKVWKDPKLDRVLACYQLAKLMFEADGRRIVNATPGGKLELFPRVDFEELF